MKLGSRCFFGNHRIDINQILSSTRHTERIPKLASYYLGPVENELSSIISTEQTCQVKIAPTARVSGSQFRTRANLLLYNTRANTGGKMIMPATNSLSQLNYHLPLRFYRYRDSSQLRCYQSLLSLYFFLSYPEFTQFNHI